MNIWIRFLTVSAIAIALGCASALPGVEAIPLDSDPDEELAQLVGELRRADESDVDLLSPAWFAKASESASQARSLRKRGGAVSEILAAVAEGRAQLGQAEAFAKIARNSIEPAIQARRDAVAAGAETLGSPWSEAAGRFRQLAEGIENDDMRWVRRTVDDVERELRRVELLAIKRNTMTRAADLIAKAQADGAEELAPRSLAKTRQLYEQLDAFITANRYSSEEMSRRAEEAVFEASRLVYVTQEAARAKKRTPEQAALERESMLYFLAVDLGLDDPRASSAEAQLRVVRTAVTELRRDRNTLAELSTSQEERIAELEGETSGDRRRIAALEAQRRFEERFAEVSGYFAPEEARVYQKEHQLVIRLRALHFPVGQHVLQPSNYALMAKVQRAIGAFDDPSVVVEGHTDSTGSTEVNERLSQARADAVRDYLVANDTLPGSRIRAIGRGFSDPLASDRTEEGRAINRRIDVIIDARDKAERLADVAASPNEDSRP